MEQQKGSMLLKVMSIIMIVGGIAGAVGSLLMGALSGVITAVADNEQVQQAAREAGTTTGKITGLMWVATAVSVVAAVVEIIAGFKGKSNWNKPEMAKTLMIWGIICLAVSLVGNILFITSDAASIISILTGLVVPALYVVGTVQLKKQA